MQYCKSLLFSVLIMTPAVHANEQDELNPAPLSPEEVAAAHELGITDGELYRVSEPMTKQARRELEAQLELDFAQLDTAAKRTDQALDAITRRAAWALERKGHHAVAHQLRTEYQEFYTNAVYYMAIGVVPVGLGDHAPLSQWLATWYQKIEDLLGEDLCKLLHIHDIKILNYGIPVVFKPKTENQWCQETQATGGVCRDEYRVHFAGVPKGRWTWEHHGVLGVTAYWVTQIVCTVGTFGAGAIGMICGPIATVVEIGTDKWISPPLSDKIFDRVNE
jgi:hypothetical protein